MTQRHTYPISDTVDIVLIYDSFGLYSGVCIDGVDCVMKIATADDFAKAKALGFKTSDEKVMPMLDDPIVTVTE